MGEIWFFVSNIWLILCIRELWLSFFTYNIVSLETDLVTSRSPLLCIHYTFYGPTKYEIQHNHLLDHEGRLYSFDKMFSKNIIQIKAICMCFGHRTNLRSPKSQKSWSKSLMMVKWSKIEIYLRYFPIIYLKENFLLCTESMKKQIQ